MTTPPRTQAPIRHTVTVPLDRAAAFDLFTAGFDRWWPREHHIGEPEMDKAIIEPFAGGRVYEIGVDGSECQWGTVTAWDPPSGFTAAWQLTAQWTFDPDLSRASEYEVTFTEVDAGTEVVVEHRHLERHGEQAAAIDAAVNGPGGWPDLIKIYAGLA